MSLLEKLLKHISKDLVGHGCQAGACVCYAVHRNTWYSMKVHDNLDVIRGHDRRVCLVSCLSRVSACLVCLVNACCYSKRVSPEERM